MEGLKEAILEHYGLQVMNHKELDGQTVLYTDRGIYYMQSSPAAYRFKSRLIDKVKKHLQKQGELEVLPLAKTVKDQPYFTVDDELHYLYLGVRESAPDNKPYFTGQTLAQFHQATCSFTGDRMYLPYSSLGSWPGMWQKKLGRYNMFRDNLDLNGGEITFFDEYLLTTYTYVYHLGDTAVQYLQDAGYQKLVKEAGSYGKIAYQNFDYGYVVLNENSKRHLTGEWCWVIDMRARDIGQWMKAEIRRNGWQAHTILQFLDGYNSVSALKENEYAVVYSLLLYPGRFLKLVDMYNDLTQDEKEQVDAEAWQARMDGELAHMETALRDYPEIIKNHYGVVIPRVDWLWRSMNDETLRFYDQADVS